MISEHRRIWKEYYGPIPFDENGRSYEIHHINNNHFDNRIENLKCVSIEEHYKIHEAQGDIMACCAIMRRMNPTELTQDQKLILSEESRQAALLRVENGTHNFLGGEIQKKHQARRKEEGTHNFVNKNPVYSLQKDGTYEIVLFCVDKLGNKKKILKKDYLKQTGLKSEWEYVTHQSLEGRRRKSSLQNNKQTI